VRPQRSQRQNPRYFGDEWVNIATTINVHSPLSEPASFLATLDWDILNEPIHERYTNLLHCVDPETNFDVHGEMGFVTHINTSDTPTLHDILNMTDTVEQEQWFEAMDSEILALLGKQTFVKVDRNVALYKFAEIVGTTWVF
jgi:hypothetical protein